MLPFAEQSATARAAQASWSNLSIRKRLRPVRALRDLMARRADSLIGVVNDDIGRPPVEVVATELLPSAAALKFLEQKAQRVLAPHRVGLRFRPVWLMGCRDVIHRRAWGVVGVIGTWNYPVYLNVGPIAQALVAGNAVLWKPSENAPRTADLLHTLFLEAGFPAALFHKLPATREAGPMLAEADIDRVVFTGSDAVGRKLAAKLGERLIPSTLELSGSDAMFVLADANIELAAKAAWFGLTLNRGQTCIAVRRIFVHRSHYAAFEESLRQLRPNTGPMKLVTSAQVQQGKRLVQDAMMRGARAMEIGSGQRSDSFPPTFLFDASIEASICREACFGPVAAVIPFDSVDEAVSLAKQCSFGLGASIFTTHASAAQNLAASIPSGSVTVNDLVAPTAHPATPFGGRGASGWGVTQGEEGLLEMTVPQVVTVQKGAFHLHFDEAVNPNPKTGDILRGLLRFTHARGIREKIRGLWKMVSGVSRRQKDAKKGREAGTEKTSDYQT